MGQEDVLRSLLHIIPNFYYFFWPLFLLGFVYGLVRCVKDRERRGAGAVYKMAGLHLGVPDIY